MENAEGLPSLRKTTNRVRSEGRESLGEREGFLAILRIKKIIAKYWGAEK